MAPYCPIRSPIGKTFLPWPPNGVVISGLPANRSSGQTMALDNCRPDIA